MNQISYNGAFNSAALSVPGVYLNILPPKGAIVRGASVGLLAIVGVASWGPVNVATPIGSPAQLAQVYGAPKVQKYDLPFAAGLALQVQVALRGGAGLVLNRVTDGTDLAAAGIFGLVATAATVAAGGTGHVTGDTITFANGVTGTVTASGGVVSAITIVSGAAGSTQATNPVAQASSSGVGIGLTVNFTTYTKQATLTSIYTGSAANGAVATIAAGSAANSWKVTIAMVGFAPEVFDNITGTGNAFWVNLANAINSGNSAQRGPSQLVVATAGNATSSPAAGSITLAGGTDGVASISASNLVGADGASRTGIYVFRGLGASHGFVADLDDHTQNATLATFTQSEGIYWGSQGPAGQTPTTGASAKLTDGTDNPWLKLYLGDWTYVQDNVNSTQRLIGPATLGMAVLSCLQPQQSGLNKQVPLLVATQRSKSGNPYAQSDLQTLVNSGIEVVANPIPRGPMFGHAIGRSSSSDQTRNTDNWPVTTSFIARSLTGPGALGPAIGQVITDDFFDTWYAVLDNFLGGLKHASPEAIIQNYQILFSRANNPQAQTASGLVVAEVLVQYFGIAQVFLVNLQSGATVVIPKSQSSFA
jgi:hypothetical protein